MSEKDIRKEARVKIENNVMEYDNSAIQLSNISSINISPIPKEPYSSWMFIGSLLGILMISIGRGTKLIGFIILMVCLINLAYVYYMNNQLGEYLTIELNSGKSVFFSCKNEQFLVQSKQAMIQAFNEKGKYMEVNFSNCSIHDLALEGNIDRSINNSTIVKGNKNQIKENYSNNFEEGKGMYYLYRAIDDELRTGRNIENRELLEDIKKLIEEKDKNKLAKKIRQNWNTIMTGSISSILGTYGTEILKKIAGL